MSKGPRNKPLSVKVTRGVLTIEIGIGTLAHAALCSEYAFGLMGPEQDRPDARFRVSKPRGFALDVKRALTDELGEDGSSLLTNVLDAAAEKAIEDGSEFFIDSEDE